MGHNDTEGMVIYILRESDQWLMQKEQKKLP